MDSSEPVRTMLLRSLVTSVLTIGSGTLIYWFMGVNPLSAVLFALATGVALALASFLV